MLAIFASEAFQCENKIISKNVLPPVTIVSGSSATDVWFLPDWANMEFAADFKVLL